MTEHTSTNTANRLLQSGHGVLVYCMQSGHYVSSTACSQDTMCRLLHMQSGHGVCWSTAYAVRTLCVVYCMQSGHYVVYCICSQDTVCLSTTCSQDTVCRLLHAVRTLHACPDTLHPLHPICTYIQDSFDNQDSVYTPYPSTLPSLSGTILLVILINCCRE